MNQNYNYIYIIIQQFQFLNKLHFIIYNLHLFQLKNLLQYQMLNLNQSPVYLILINFMY